MASSKEALPQHYRLATGMGIGAHPAEAKSTAKQAYAHGGKVKGGFPYKMKSGGKARGKC